MTSREQYAPGPASAAQVIKDGAQILDSPKIVRRSHLNRNKWTGSPLKPDSGLSRLYVKRSCPAFGS